MTAATDQHDPDVVDDQVVEADPPGTVRRQVDPVSRLSIRELGKGSRKLQADLLTAVRPGHYLYPEAAAVVAWLLALRDDPSASLGTFQRMTWGELMGDGGPLDLGTELVVDDVEADQVEADPEVDVEADALAAVVAADPTAPRPGS